MDKCNKNFFRSFPRNFFARKKRKASSINWRIFFFLFLDFYRNLIETRIPDRLAVFLLHTKHHLTRALINYWIIFRKALCYVRFHKEEFARAKKQAKERRRRSEMQMRFTEAARERCRYSYLNSRSHLFKLSFLSRRWWFERSCSNESRTARRKDMQRWKSWNLCKFNVAGDVFFFVSNSAKNIVSSDDFNGR